MLHLLTTYAVPLNLVLLMLVAGTEIRRCHFAQQRILKPVVVGALGQLLLLPLIAIGIVYSMKLHPVVAAGVVILSLCPGGGISNTYCYIARCSVLISALITAAGTVFCLVTIPAWIFALSILPALEGPLAPIPAATVLGHLFAYLIVPLAIGAAARELAPETVERLTSALRKVSIGLVAAILATALASVASQIPELLIDVTMTAGLFIVAAMTVGAALGYTFTEEERHVITIESGVRNIGLALTLGALTMKSEDFPLLAAFLTGYLAIEIAILLPYAALVARRLGRIATARP